MKKIYSFILIILIILNMLVFPDGDIYGQNAQSSYPAPPEVKGESVILMEADSGAILYEKDCHKILYPASITKIMTGLLTIENCQMDDLVTYQGKDLSTLPSDAAKLGLVAGEEMTVRDSLYALLLRSCNDVAVGLSVKISATEEEFAKLMTERAKTAGAINTNFVNSTGLHDENHYTTAYDMAMITKAALSNPIFCEISGTEEYVLPVTNKCDVQRTQYNRHEMLTATKSAYYSYAVAGKTGYTDEAGRTLVTVAKRNGITLICVFMNTTDEYVYNDTKLLFEYGFNHFEKVNIAENETRFSQNGKDFFTKMSDIFINTGSLITLGKSDYVMVPEGNTINDLTYEIQYSTDTAGGKIASLQYYCGDKIMGKTTVNVGKSNNNAEDGAAPVLIADDEGKTDISDIPINIWLVVVGIVIIILIIIYIIYLIKTKEKRKRKKERKKVFKESKKRFKRRKKRPIKFR